MCVVFVPIRAIRAFQLHKVRFSSDSNGNMNPPAAVWELYHLYEDLMKTSSLLQPHKQRHTVQRRVLCSGSAPTLSRPAVLVRVLWAPQTSASQPFYTLNKCERNAKGACCAEPASLCLGSFLPTHIIACWPLFIQRSPASLLPDEATVNSVQSTPRSICLTPAERRRLSGLSGLRKRGTGEYNEQIKQKEGEETMGEVKRSVRLRRCLFCFWPASLAVTEENNCAWNHCEWIRTAQTQQTSVCWWNRGRVTHASVF